MEIATTYNNIKRKQVLMLLALGLFLIISAVFCVMMGPAKISPLQLLRPENYAILNLRIYRILLGMVAGAGLGVAGAILQGLLRNPLAEPYILGISSGAGFGAALAMALGLTSVPFLIGLVPLAAFIGAILTMMLVYSLAKVGGKLPVQTLILAGVIVGTVLSSLLIFTITVSGSKVLHSALWWLLGNLQIFDTQLLITVSIIALAGTAGAHFFSRELNAIALGEEEAIHLGIEIERIKKILFVITSLITAAVVSACGIIGFVGLIVPHTMRLIVGPNHRILIPASALGGAIFLILCDCLARTVMSPTEIPIGVITALMGGPFFLVLLRKKLKK